MAPTQAENLIGTVAAALNAVANPRNPIVKGKLPPVGSWGTKRLNPGAGQLDRPLTAGPGEFYKSNKRSV